MKSKNSTPTAAQQRWWSDLVDMGCVISGGPAEIDHCVGAKARHNKIDIGNWWVIALNPRLHRTDQSSRSNDRAKFGKDWANCIAYHYVVYAAEKQLFLAGCCKYIQFYKKDLPFDYDVMQAILGYTR